MNYGVYAPGSGRVVNAQLKVLVADITLTNNGSFESIPIPTGFDSLEILWALRSTVSATSDVGRIWFNGDTTDANYSNQYVNGLFTTVVTARGDNAQLRELTGSTSTAGDYGVAHMLIPFHQQPGVRRNILSLYADRRDATSHEVSIQAFNWESTEPITSITIRTDNHPTDLLVAGSRVQVFGLGTFAVALAR